MAKTMKQFIFERMAVNGYVLDQEVANFLGKEEDVNWYTVEQYKRQYQQLEWAKREFGEMKNPIIKKTYRKYLIREDSWKDKDKYYVIPKIYYDYLKNKK